jgi:poly(hydroxyalkanoate) depolymerase family esterase
MTALHDMLKATHLVRSGRLKEAADLIRATVRGGAQTAKEATDRTPRPALGDAAPDFVGPTQMRFFGLPSAPLDESAEKGLNRRGAGRKTAEVLQGLRLPLPSARPPSPVPVPDGASFLEHSCRSAHGELVYKLYVPSGYKGEPLPLLVMLHGCTQSPDDFAVGTRMNAAAEEWNLFVAYPAQQQSANVSKCWNWFRSGDQRRDSGEPAKIAAATRQIMAQYPVQRDRVYAAGLSAGGAAAAILGVQYPDLYAAVGVHSGLACGAAHDLSSAMAAMRTGGSPAAIHLPNHSAPPTRAIVFHGDRDNTVNPINSDQVLAQFQAKAEPLLATTLERQTANGLAYTRTVYVNAGGIRVFENWVVHGAGHAWSGGSRDGSYTEPRGPDASREMLRFFLDEPKKL